MVPPLGKITSFFKPFVAKKKEYDGDSITVLAAPSVQAQSLQKPVTPSLGSLKRSISPRPSSKKPAKPIKVQDSRPIKSSTTSQCQASPPKTATIERSTTPQPEIEITLTQDFESPESSTSTIVPPIVRTVQEVKPAALTNANSSFSSNSSRRVVVNGMKAVTNSDSDSLSSSDDELEDVSSFMPRKRIKITPRPVVAPKKQYRHSLSNMVQQVEKNEASTARIKEAEADLSSDDAEVLGNDSEQERVMAALKRIDALEQSDVFYFFNGESSPHQPNPWPPWELLAPLLHTDSGRELAISSKFLTDLAGQIDIPEDVLDWIYRALQVEPSQVLCEEYLSILQAASRSSSAPSRIHYPILRDAYHGQLSLNVRTATPVGLPRSLSYNLRLLASLGGSLVAPEEQAHALVDLFLLNLDEHVRSSIDIQLEVGNTMQAVLQACDATRLFSTTQSAVKQILEYDSLTSQQMARGIACLPATTTSMHHFRRQLALQYMLNAPSHDLFQPASPDTGQRLLKVLTSNPLFAVTRETIWPLFHWNVHLIDICIDAGFSDFAFMASEISTETQDEKMFNKQIDDIAQRLRHISNNIPDAGTSHLRRTEAKSTLDRLVLRIELSVRTRPKRKAAAFGGSIGAGQQDLFKNFLSMADSDDDDDPPTLQSKTTTHSTKNVKFLD